MFNFFEQLKSEYNFNKNVFEYNFVMIGGGLAYIEGHKGILKLQEDTIVLRVKGGILQIKGTNLFLKELTKNTVTIQGKIVDIGVL